MEEEKSKKNKRGLLYLIFKRVKIRHFIVLALLLVANTAAWFIYVNTVSNSIDVKVKSWRIDFTDGETPVSQLVSFTVDSVAPGMTTYTHSIRAHNYSDVSANVTYKILQARIMNDTYYTVEGRTESGQQLDGTELTSDQLINKLANDYPFTITFSISSDTINAGNGVASFNIQLEWPYEAGHDENDTIWGINAYNFKTAYPDTPSINIEAKIYITQATS